MLSSTRLELLPTECAATVKHNRPSVCQRIPSDGKVSSRWLGGGPPRPPSVHASSPRRPRSAQPAPSSNGCHHQPATAALALSSPMRTIRMHAIAEVNIELHPEAPPLSCAQRHPLRRRRRSCARSSAISAATLGGRRLMLMSLHGRTISWRALWAEYVR